MIPFLLALAQVAATPPAPADPAQSTEALAAGCQGLVRTAPEQAIRSANEWRLRGGGLDARQCLGLAYVQLERWEPAATTFEQAAREAETAQDPRQADFWVQAGNSWLAADDGAKARRAFDTALATTQLSPELRGEVHLDRARAQVALGDAAAARTDIDRGLELVPADPYAWYLSAALARREGDLARAQSDIAKAVELAPDDADVLLEAANVSGLSGNLDAARAFFARAARAAPDSPSGRAAAAALDANPAPAVSAAETPEPR